MVSPDAAARFLAAPWLADLDEPARQALLAVLEEGRAAAGTVLLAEGKPNDHIHFLLEGSATITRAYPGRDEEVVTTLNGPSQFGESSFFRGKPPIVQVRTTTPVLFLRLDRAGYEQFRQSRPRGGEQFALAMLRLLAERFDLLDLRVSEFLQEQGNGHPKATEWAEFRRRLFDSGL